MTLDVAPADHNNLLAKCTVIRKMNDGVRASEARPESAYFDKLTRRRLIM